jgi:hypothetical protein
MRRETRTDLHPIGSSCGVFGRLSLNWATGREVRLTPKYEAQSRRCEREARESEEGDGRAPRRVREHSKHVRPHEAAHVAQRTHECDARCRGGPAQQRRGYAPKRCIKRVDADRHERNCESKSWFGNAMGRSDRRPSSS